MWKMKDPYQKGAILRTTWGCKLNIKKKLRGEKGREGAGGR
jgi:hypothetical protein